MKLVEIDLPQAIGVLNKILRRLEEYQAIRAADPQATYNDVAMVRELWEEVETRKEDAGVPLAPPVCGGDHGVASDADAGPIRSGNVTGNSANSTGEASGTRSAATGDSNDAAV